MRGGPDPNYQYGMNAAQAAADKLGVKLVTYTANNDPTQELANVQDAITKGVDGNPDLCRVPVLRESRHRPGEAGRRANLLPIRL